jgi:hypothetical protein
MTEIIDPAAIGEKRPASQIKMGWHVAGGLAAHDAFVGNGTVVVNVRMDSGVYEGREFRRDQYVWTRTPEEQIQYIEAKHKQLLAQAGVAAAQLSSQPIPVCHNPACVHARREVKRLNGVFAAMRASGKARGAQ